MARNCIYCGRELARDEKCTCRSAQNRAGAATGGAGRDNGSPKDRPAADAAGSGQNNRTGTKGTGWQARFQAWRLEQKRRLDARKGSRQPTGRAASSAPHRRDSGKVRRDFMMRLPSILNRLQRASRYVVRPVDAIRLSVQYPATKRTLSFLGVLAIMAGLVFMNAIRNPQIAPLSGNFRVLPPLLLFAEGMALGIAAILLLALFYRLAMLFLHRRNYAYHILFDALSPVALYTGLAMLLVFLALQTSLFSALTVLAVGLGISHLVQFFVIRQLTNLDENHSIVLVLVANLLCMSALGVVLSLF